MAATRLLGQGGEDMREGMGKDRDGKRGNM